MKKFTLTAVFLFASVLVCSQSINLADLTNLNTLTMVGEDSFLTSDNRFKLVGIQQINGLPVAEYQNVQGAPLKLETLTIGMGKKSPSGEFLRTIIYNSSQNSFIRKLKAQAIANRFTLYFEGRDNNYNIFLYDNTLYQLNIYLRRDETSGYIELKQKDIVPSI
jgi:hypothetical protein